MDVNSFLGALSAKPSVTEGGKVDPVERDSGEPVAGTTVDARHDAATPSSATEEPSQIVTDTTPSGIEVLYQAKPKRLYKVRGPEGVALDDRDWFEVPSVTTVLDLIHKPALTWYGQRMGIQGVLDLFDLGVLSTAFDWDVDKERLTVGETYATEPLITDALKEHRLTVNHRTDKAADRGVNVHDALEQWGITGELPSPKDFPESESGYVAGLVGFLEDVRPTPIRQEVMVGSVVHGFAGRFDLVIETKEEREFTSRCYPKRGDKRETLPAGSYLCDLKTSRGTYVSHHLQLAAYELAAVECGYPATDKQAIIHVTAEGQYELVFSTAKAENFLAIRKAYDALREVSA